MTSTAALVTAAQAGDRKAFGELYRLYGRMVHGILLARTPISDVEDLTQEVFLRGLERLGGLREPAAFGGWIATIARRVAADRSRRAPREVELAEDLAAPEPAGEAWAVLRLIRALPEAYREPLVLRLVEGMSGPEIAERTGLTAGSVRVNLHRGYEMLRARLGESR
jgi:RNA polymerase sigma-70 factor (ECF subfamily)